MVQHPRGRDEQRGRRERDLLKRLLGIAIVGLAVAVAALVASASASAEDYAPFARNVVPSGQYGSVPPPPDADQQAKLYDGLTPLFDHVTGTDLGKYFKSEQFGVGEDGPGTKEDVPHAGIKIFRDTYGVPHIYADTMSDGVWASGWLLAEDRGLLLQQARYAGRVAAVDVPGITALGVLTSLGTFVPSDQTENEISKQTKVLKNHGKEGKAVLADIDTFIDGINAYLKIHSPSIAPWTRNDVYAVNALKGQFLGQGGGREAENSTFLSGLEQRLGDKKGMKVFNDVRQFRNKGVPASLDKKFPYGHIPDSAPGSVVLDHGSYEQTPAVQQSLAQKMDAPSINASNTLQINADRSTTGNPLMVGGPQIGYFYPGFTYEEDMHAGRMKWRGVTSAPFPGYLLIGRGQDFAVTLTSASADIIDQYAETLCGGSDTKYKYKGKCRNMKPFDAGTLNGDPVRFMTTVHGPVTGYATVNGRKVAISSKRSSYGKDTLDQLFFRKLSTGAVDSPKTFYKAAAKTPQTFNSFYMDNRHNAEYTSGLLPKRPKGTDPGLPTKGTGKYEWQGWLSDNKHPHGKDPKGGELVNWNQNIARGFGAADDQWGRMGSVNRVSLLFKNLTQQEKSNGKWNLQRVTSAMNEAATQDVLGVLTVPLLNKLLKGSKAPNPQAEQMLAVMKHWHRQGSSLLDRNLDGLVDDPGAASMGAAWDGIANALMRPRIGSQLDELDSLFSRFDAPPGGQYSGWYQYFDRDIRSLLGKKVKAPFNVSYCGKGNLERCQTAVWNAIAKAGVQEQAQEGTANPANWHADADAMRITFAPGILSTTMRYTNRPSGIQQVITFAGHRR